MDKKSIHKTNSDLVVSYEPISEQKLNPSNYGFYRLNDLAITYSKKVLKPTSIFNANLTWLCPLVKIKRK